jgi:hypothetical protein
VEGLDFLPKKSTDVEDISSEMQQFSDIHHVCLKTFCKTPFLRGDCVCVCVFLASGYGWDAL